MERRRWNTCHRHLLLPITTAAADLSIKLKHTSHEHCYITRVVELQVIPALEFYVYMREPPLRKTWEYSNITKLWKMLAPGIWLEDLIKPNQASHQGARWTSSVSMLTVPVLALIIETSWICSWCSRSFQDICRGQWIMIAELTCGLFPMIYCIVCPSWFCSYSKMPSVFRCNRGKVCGWDFLSWSLVPVSRKGRGRCVTCCGLPIPKKAEEYQSI
jgi:hypothetical protein